MHWHRSIFLLTSTLIIFCSIRWRVTINISFGSKRNLFEFTRKFKILHILIVNDSFFSSIVFTLAIFWTKQTLYRSKPLQTHPLKIHINLRYQKRPLSTLPFKLHGNHQIIPFNTLEPNLIKSPNKKKKHLTNLRQLSKRSIIGPFPFFTLPIKYRY